MTEEVGFFTDQIGGTPINSGYYYYCPILPIPGSPRDDPWPAPYSPNGYYSVTLLLYDESTNTFV